MNDDYFLAIKLLFNNRHYVSCAKLLMSFIDTVAFVDFGNVSNPFILWLDAYADLPSLGITSKEWWEYRNGLLHMTNLNSRAVASGKTVPLICYLGNAEKRDSFPALPSRAKYFHLKRLIDTIAYAVSRWLATYNEDRGKFALFVSRYDLVVSDSRLTYANLPENGR